MLLNKRIPTILGLFFLLAAVITAVILSGTPRRLFSQASPQTAPENIRATNITDKSFVVSYTTAEPATGRIILSDGRNFSDDRGDGKFTTHYFPVKNLDPATKYSFKIVSQSQSYPSDAATSPLASTPVSLIEPVYGSVSNPDGTPAVGALVYAETDSAQVKANGNFLLSVKSASGNIFIEGGAGGQSQINCPFEKGRPFPGVILGKDVSCQTISSPSVSQFSRPQVSPQVNLLSPAENDRVSTGLPTFRGTAPPEKILQIEIHSPLPVVSSFRPSADGSWSWTPPQNLSPGQHTATLTYVDDAGAPQKLIRNFTVEAAGILPETIATPSPSPTIVYTPPVSIPPPAPPPATGSLFQTLTLLTIGLILVTLGMRWIYQSFSLTFLKPA